MQFRNSNLRRIWLAAGLGVAMIAGQAASARDNLPTGRTAVEIKDGVYPASYFPNTEILGADEMRVTSLGTGMPKDRKSVV